MKLYYLIKKLEVLDHWPECYFHCCYWNSIDSLRKKNRKKPNRVKELGRTFLKQKKNGCKKIQHKNDVLSIMKGTISMSSFNRPLKQKWRYQLNQLGNNQQLTKINKITRTFFLRTMKRTHELRDKPSDRERREWVFLCDKDEENQYT